MTKKKKVMNDTVNPQPVETEEEDFTLEVTEEGTVSASKEKKNDTHFMKIISLLLAVVLWCFVVLNENPNRSIWIRDVAVQVVNKNTLQARDLVILEEEPLRIDVRLEGQQNALSSITAESIRAQIDLSAISEAGAVTMPASIDIPGTSGIVIAEQKNAGGSLVIDVIREAKIPVKPKVTGETAMRDGYALGTATVSPDTVTVKAPKTILDKITAVTESVDISNKTESGSTEVSVLILDGTGAPFTPITCEPKKTTLNYTLNVTSLVKIEPTLENVSALNTRYDVYASATVPDSVTVRGDDISMHQLNKLPTEPIDVLALYEGFEQGFLSTTEWNRASFVTTVPVKLAFPEGISAVGTEDISEIEVSITYMNLSSKEDPYQIDSDGFPIATEPNEATAEEAEEEPEP